MSGGRKNILETSEELLKLHSKRVEKILNYTRNEWRRCLGLAISLEDEIPDNNYRDVIISTIVDWLQNTLETSGEDVKIHSKRVGKM
jgi:hypothetical protein